jgi:hypothetical protein
MFFCKENFIVETPKAFFTQTCIRCKKLLWFSREKYVLVGILLENNYDQELQESILQ